MTNTAVRVDLTVEIDTAEWAEDYDLPAADVRNDIRAAVARVAEDWLRNQAGYQGASVRINLNPRMASFRQ